MVPLGRVDTDEIVVESLLGRGAFGVVVLVRLERQGAQDQTFSPFRFLGANARSYSDS